MVRSVPFLLLVAIFVPKFDTRGTFSEAPICVFDAEREVTGPALVPPKINACRQDQNHEFLDLDQFVLGIMQNGYKILFRKSP